MDLLQGLGIDAVGQRWAMPASVTLRSQEVASCPAGTSSRG
jgi:hypothetical protein